MTSLERLVALSALGLVTLVPTATAETAVAETADRAADATRHNFERTFFLQAQPGWSPDSTRPRVKPDRVPKAAAPEPEATTVKADRPTPVVDQAAIADRQNADRPIMNQPVPRKPAKQSASTVAQTSPAPETPAPTTAPPAPTFSPRVGARYNSQGAGINDVVGIEGFVPFAQQPGRSIAFLEGRGLYDLDNKAFGGNVILGYRQFDARSNRVLGGYIAYDNRDTGENFFNQVGIGIETLGDEWDGRINAYFPVGETRKQTSESFGAVSFQQSSLLFDRTRRFEAGLTGFDLEYGRKLLTFGQSGSLRGYLGVYYFAGNEGDDAIGGRLRLAARINEFAAVGLTLQSDRLFDTRLIFSVALNFPTVAPKNGNANSVLARLGSSVERNISITVDDQKETNRVTAASATTGQPLQVLHVNLGAAGGNGTVESPFGTVDQALGSARSGSIVYVRSGTNPGIAGFVVPAGVSVLSTAPQQLVNTQQIGQVLLPNSGTGVLPNVNGTVRVNSDSTLSGFAITSPSSVGIRGDNVIGRVAITDNAVNNTGGISTDGAITLNHSSGTLNVEVLRNRISNTTNNGVSIVTTGTGITTGNVSQNVISNTRGSGIRFFNLDNAVVTPTISNNQITGNVRGAAQDGGIRIGLFNVAQVTPTITNNTIFDNSSTGIFVGSEADSIARATITNNTIRNNLGNGIFLGSQNNSQVIGTIANNTISQTRVDNNLAPGNAPTGNGIFFGSRDTGRASAAIADNTANDNEASGINFFVANSSFSTADIIRNTTNNNRTSGIEINVGIPSPDVNTGIVPPPAAIGTLQGTANILNNTAAGNLGQGPVNQGGAGIVIRTLQNADFQVAIQGNQIRDNGTAAGALGGIGFLSLNNSRIFTGVRFNTFVRNSPAINAQATPGTRICARLINNTNDAPFILVRTPNSIFQADTTGNAGPPAQQPALPITAIGDCVTP
jgi:hypothetical protein